ncbi:MAG: PAS domain S-box protein, partial [Bacteroidales bacterium]|nr:PAS domain S-box protein [Bacteroidales bacterium]
DFILSYDLKGRITYANRALCEALGMSYEQITGKRNREMGLRPEECRQFDSAIHDVILKGESLRKRISFTTNNSDLRHYDAYIHPIFNFSGLLIGISAILRDITEIITYEEMLRNSRDELRELSRKMESIREMERKEIAINLHDDLGQKLTILKIGLNMLKTEEKTDDGQFREKVNDLMHIVDDTVKIVHRLSSDLRPSLLYDFGLPEALKYHLEEFS